MPALLLLACSEEVKTPPPPNVLAEGKMVEVLVDIQLIEGAYHKRIIKAENTRKAALDGYVQVFEKYDISQAQFDSSYTWYLDAPKRMDHLLELVMNELSKMKAQKEAELD